MNNGPGNNKDEEERPAETGNTEAGNYNSDEYTISWDDDGEVHVTHTSEEY